MPNEFRVEKDLLNDYLLQYIFEKFKHNTSSNNMFKTISGYSILRRCQKFKKGCNSKWYVKIDVHQKSVHIERKIMCNHIASFIRPSKTEKSIF